MNNQELIQNYKDKIIDGQELALKIRQKIKNSIIELNEINKCKHNEKPILGYIIVGNKSES